ncbi:MAG: hypothetical protein WC291_00240 [Thermodesulfovibrionales bacterium]|jgi:hypothetical protein
MTKKNYIVLAASLNRTKSMLKSKGLDDNTVMTIMDTILPELCNVLRRDNPRFDADKFYAAVYKD